MFRTRFIASATTVSIYLICCACFVYHLDQIIMIVLLLPQMIPSLAKSERAEKWS